MHRKKHLVFDRIINTLTDKNISIPCFQKRIGVISQNWTNWRNRGVPTKEYERIALELDLNLEWLMFEFELYFQPPSATPNEPTHNLLGLMFFHFYHDHECNIKLLQYFYFPSSLSMK